MIEVPYIVQLKESANTVDLILKYSLKLFYSSGISIMKKWQLRNCSYEFFFFFVALPLLCLYIWIISRLSEIYFGGLLDRKILQETNIQNDWHKLDENLVILSVTISGFGIPIICFWGSSTSNN